MKDQNINIAVLDCALKQKELKSFASLQEKFSDITFHYFSVQDSDWFEEISAKTRQFNGYFIFGSISNVEDNQDWHHQIRSIMDQELHLNKPVLGICFGHQLMAHHFGATVIKRKSHRQGIHQLNISTNFQNHFDPIIYLVFEHSFEVRNLPTSLVRMGGVDADDFIAHKTLPFWGIQAHPEATVHFTNRFKQLPKEEDFIRAMNDGFKIIQQFFKLHFRK